MHAKTLARAALIALSLAAPAAIPVGRASATGSPITLSISSGRPFARPIATVAACVDDQDHQRTLSVQLISGKGHGAVLAGRAQGWPGHPAILVVPDWVNPSVPAFVEASCSTIDLTDGTASNVAYASAPFDVLPPVMVPRQVTALSRTSLKAGQGLSITGAGCLQPDTDFAFTTAYEGADLTGRSFGAAGPGSYAEVTGGNFTTQPFFAAGSVEYDLENTAEISTGFDPQTAQISHLVEEPVVFATGPNTLITECYHQDGSALLFRPQVVNLVANPAVSQVELDAPGPGRGVRIQGQACTVGSVHITMGATSLQQIRAWSTPTDAGSRESTAFRPASRGRPGPPTDARHRTLTARSVPRAASPTQRITGDLTTTGLVDTTVNPSPAGAWSYADQTAFDDGVVTGLAICGDPFGTGFFYDFQGLHKNLNDG